MRGLCGGARTGGALEDEEVVLRGGRFLEIGLAWADGVVDTSSLASWAAAAVRPVG